MRLLNFCPWAVVVVALSLSLAACNRSPSSVMQTENPNFKVAFLFEHEGCRVYRFEDFYTRYFVNCGPAGAAVSWHESQGKSGTRPVEIPTGAQ